MKFDKLKGRILEKHLTYAQLSTTIGISKVTFAHKINGRREWKRNEMEQICNALDIDLDEIHLYFFN